MFASRNADVFGQLAELETQHFRRRLSDDSFIHSRKLLPEPLVKMAAPPSTPIEVHDSDGFLVPSSQPVRKRKGPNFTDRRSADCKWTHYSLADVDEDAGMEQGGRALAMSVLARIRKRVDNFSGKTGGVDMEQDETEKVQHRIMFRPSRGTKKARFLNADSDQSTSIKCLAMDEIESDSIASELSGAESASLNEEPYFTKRKTVQKSSRRNKSSDTETTDTSIVISSTLRNKRPDSVTSTYESKKSRFELPSTAPCFEFSEDDNMMDLVPEGVI
ncbi:hypothetical protein Ciccas_003411 [Cichlidogyrus casuarinus]|uniref:Protein TSSC4 n=1 Tax=Cichlidogyrus casuarinus TaxID=1844966 RepID=A0ABD2QHR0_9PLAT